MPNMLEGIKVLDLTTVVFGPYATQTLADLGAEVIKVEAPGGDTMRYAGKPARTRGMGPVHLGLNRGKASIVLDLKAADDVAAMRELIARSDVFIHNVRGKAIAALGFDYAAVKAIKPDIVYVHCVGFGSDGPYADLQAYDDIIQAATGTASLAGRVNGDPTPRYIPSLIADKVAGLHGAYAVMAALIHRLRTGEGQFVEVPMFEAFTHFMLKEHLFGETFDPPVGTVGYPRQLDPHRQPFPTADGHISIVPYTDEAIVILFEVLGAPERLTGPLSTPVGRAKDMSEVYRLVAELTPARTTQDWLDRCHQARLPAIPVRDLADIRNDPHLAVSFFRRREHPTEGAIVDMAPPVRFGVPLPEPAPAPSLGADGEAIRAMLRDNDGRTTPAGRT
jgi:crotonobetainyl-CoA:carnitine CoA-transferase CaiB-like acyl-CoA transferase